MNTKKLSNSKLFVIAIISIIIVIIIYFINFKINNNTSNFDTNINEKIVFNVNGSNILFTYDFINNKVNKYSSGEIEKTNLLDSERVLVEITSNIYVENGIVYRNGEKIFSCNVSICPFYLDMSGKYLVFIDKPYYKELFFKKLYSHYTFRVVDINSEMYKDYPIIDYNGEQLNIQGIEGYINK